MRHKKEAESAFDRRAHVDLGAGIVEMSAKELWALREGISESLSATGLPHKNAGTVFVVPDVRLARSALSQAGFYPSPISAVALVEPQTRCAVQLIEERI